MTIKQASEIWQLEFLKYFCIAYAIFYNTISSWIFDEGIKMHGP